MLELRAHHEDEDVEVHSLGPVLLIHIRGELRLEHLAAMLAAGRSLADRYPSRVGTLTLARTGMPIPSMEVRDRAKEYTMLATWTAATATVMGGAGFWASITRSVHTAMTYLGSAKSNKVFADAMSAAAWLEQETPLEQAEAAALRDWVRQSPSVEGD